MTEELTKEDTEKLINALKGVAKDKKKEIVTVEEITEAQFDLLTYTTLKECSRLIQKAERTYIEQHRSITSIMDEMYDMQTKKRLLKVENRMKYYMTSDGNAYYEFNKREMGFK